MRERKLSERDRLSRTRLTHDDEAPLSLTGKASIGDRPSERRELWAWWSRRRGVRQCRDVNVAIESGALTVSIRTPHSPFGPPP